MPKKQNLKNKGNYVGNLLVKFRNKDCKTTELELLFQVLPVRIVTFVETLGSHLKLTSIIKLGKQKINNYSNLL